MRPRAGSLARLVGPTVFTVGCAVAPAGPVGEPEPLPPPGLGTLRQDEVSVALTSGELRLMVTPLDESVTRVTAPDTYRRLRGLVDAHGPRARSRAGDPEAALFLVSFFTEAPTAEFVPEEVQLISRGLRVRPASIVAVTPTWGQRRLRQRETEMAVYAFSPPVDLESDLVVAYGLVESGAWAAILPRVQAERARARARRQASSPYLAILR